MSDIAPAEVTTPAADTSAPVNGFTSQPIQVAPEPVATTKAETTETKTEPVKADGIVSALAKANQEARLTKKAVAERDAKIEQLTKEIESAKEFGIKATNLEKELADIVANPSLLLKKGRSFEEILNSLGKADEEPVDPRIAAIEAKLAEQEKAAKEQAEKDEKAKAERETAEIAAANERARANIAALIKDEGVKPDATGNERWALVSMDDTAIERARVEVLKYIAEKEPNANNERAIDLVKQALDQMETVARDETNKRAAKLKPQPNPHNNDGLGFTKPPSQDTTREQLRPTPGIDANVRGNPLPPPGVKTAHGFTGLLR